MPGAAESRLAGMFDRAERSSRCLVLKSQADERAARRRSDRIIFLAHRICVRAAYWSRLGPKERLVHLARSLPEIHPKWVFAYTTAAVLHGLYVSFADIQQDGSPVLYVRGKTREIEYTGFTVRFRPFAPNPGSPTRVLGVPVIDLFTTALECACALPFPRALAIADSVARFYGLGREQMLGMVEICGRGIRGIKTARRAFAHANGLSENGGESIARGVMIEEGFLEPLLQVAVVDPVDGEEYRPDYTWTDGVRTIAYGEHDGEEKLRDEGMRGGRSVAHAARAERLRESRLTVGGVKVVRFTPELVEDRRTFARLLDAHGILRVEGGARC